MIRNVEKSIPNYLHLSLSQYFTNSFPWVTADIVTYSMCSIFACYNTCHDVVPHGQHKDSVVSHQQGPQFKLWKPFPVDHIFPLLAWVSSGLPYDTKHSSTLSLLSSKKDDRYRFIVFYIQHIKTIGTGATAVAFVVSSRLRLCICVCVCAWVGVLDRGRHTPAAWHDMGRASLTILMSAN